MEKPINQVQYNYPFEFNPADLQHVPLFKYEKDFTFIINNKKYKTNRIIADLLSPKISQLHFTDETFFQLEINTTKKGNFGKLLEIIENQKTQTCQVAQAIQETGGKNIEGDEGKEGGNDDADDDEKGFICEILKILGNEKYFDIHPKFQEQKITKDNVFDRIEEKLKYLRNNELAIFNSENEQEQEKPENILKSKKIIEKEIEFISENFHEIEKGKEKDKMKELEAEMIEDIIRNRKLKIYDEDSLLTFLTEIYEEDHSKSYLFEYVEYINLSDEKMKEFIERFNIEDMNYGIWESMNKRLISKLINQKEKNNKSFEDRYTKKIVIKTTKIKEFRGIIYHLTKEAEGNICDKGIVNITSSGVLNSSAQYQPRNIVDHSIYEHFYSSSSNPSWICIDFKDRMVEASHYSIQSQWDYGVNNYNLKDWVLEGSTDNNTWTILDQKNNSQVLNGYGKVGTFEIGTKLKCRFIRLRLAGQNWANNYHLVINSIEFYGDISK